MERVLAGSPFTDVEFIDAVDGRAIGEAARRERFDYRRFGLRCYGQPSPGEVGCTLSHFDVWKRVAASGEPAIVMEDDISFRGEWGDLPQVMERWISRPGPRVLSLSRHFFYFKSESLPGYIISRPYMNYGTEFYVMSSAGAELLVSLGSPHYLADDWAYFSRQGLINCCILPHPVVHGCARGSIICDHYQSRRDWEGMRRSALPDIFLFDYYRTLMLTIFEKLHILRRHLGPSEI